MIPLRGGGGGGGGGGNAGDLWHQSGKKSARVFLFKLSWWQTNPESQSVRWINTDIGPLKF